MQGDCPATRIKRIRVVVMTTLEKNGGGLWSGVGTQDA